MMKKSTQYFVSSINGNDSNDGKTSETAFLTLDRINSLELNPGDKILLEMGSVFKKLRRH